MLTEQQIIELAKAEYAKVTDDVITYNPDSISQKWLIAFANALHAEFIKSLGEPVGKIFNGNVVVPNENEFWLADLYKLPNGTKLYALPNDK